MPAYGVIGAQWGDEGKGKVVDYLAEKVQWVVRFGGGNNAGHTVHGPLGEFRFHLVPVGILWPQVSCVIGNGVVVDPEALIAEMDDLNERGIDTSSLYISERAHLIMPYHVLLDRLEEEAKGDKALGTTGRGVGPAYVDKTGRTGIRAGDLLDVEDTLLPRLKQVIEPKNALLTKVYGQQPISLDDLYQQCLKWGQRLKEHIAPTEVMLQRALEDGQKVLLEGAQGSMLDLDHGSYPYVTSSSPSIGGACVGLGLSPRAIERVAGVFKAYCTRVGSGPMPSEMLDDTGNLLREKASEYGTTTGRPRRIGWFDAVAGRYTALLNGFDCLVLTRLDVLDGLPSVKICIAYEVDGQVTKDLPGSTSVLERCQPVYEEIPGWNSPTAGATDINQLPKEAMTYVRRIEELVGCPVHLISTGPNREETILVKRLF